MNQLEDDGERMVALGHPAIGPLQVLGAACRPGLEAGQWRRGTVQGPCAPVVIRSTRKP